MINVSNEFKEFMEESSDFRPHADITFLDGRTLSLSTPDLSVTGNTVSDSAASSGIPLGSAICRSIQLQILNPDEMYKDYDFYGAEIHLYTTAQLSETVETIENGRFTVTSPEDYGTTITVTAFDTMYRADKPYSTALTFPASAGAVLRDLCTSFKIPLATSVFKNDDFIIETAPTSDYTVRQIIGYIAMIACGNARVSRSGYLEIISYDLDFSKGYHELKKWKDITIGADDIAVSEIRTTAVGEEGEDIVYSAYSNAVVITDDGKTVFTDDGKLVVASVPTQDDSYILSVSNPLTIGHEQDFVNSIADAISGIPFRKFSGEHICYPLAEFMDLVEVYDWRGNAYWSFVTDLNFTFFGFTAISNSAESGIQSGSSYPSPTTKAISEAKKLVAKERSDRELAQKRLENQLSNSTGMYTTEVPQESGGIIRYVHDKPTLAESQLVTKYAADAIGLSTDGGNTYPYGFMINGDVITRYLYAVGIDAYYITTGAFTVRDSSDRIIFSADKDTKKTTIADWEVGYGYMRNKDSSGRYVGTGNNGISQAFYAGGTKADGSDGVFRVNHSGQLVATNAVISGKITGETIDIKASKEMTSYGLWEAALTANSNDGILLSYDQGNYGGRVSMNAGVTEIADLNSIIITSPQDVEINGFDVSITAGNGVALIGSASVTGQIDITGAIKCANAYTNTVTNAANLCITSNYIFRRSTASSMRYKHSICPLKYDLDAKKLLSVPVVQYVYNADYLSEDDARYGQYIPGFIAEDIARYYPIAAETDDEGKPEDWNIRMVVPPMLALIQDAHKDITALDTRINVLQSRIDATATEIERLKKKISAD